MAIEAAIWLAVTNLHNAWTYSTLPIGPIADTAWRLFMDKLRDYLQILEGSEDEKGRALIVDDGKIKPLQAVYLAEDAIHTFLLSTNLQKQKVFIKFPSFLRSSKVQFRFSNEMKKCLDQLADSVPVELRKRASDENPEHILKRLMLHYDISIKYCEVLDEKLLTITAFHQINNEEDIVDFDSEVSELCRLILTSEKLLISVVGVAGSGKTTLAKRVYNHSEIKKIFHNRAWVCVSLDFKEKNILVQPLKQVTEVRDEEKLPLEKLQEKLRNLLNRQRYLIILDDVHAPAIWEKLQVVFPNLSNGSRVILTIREPDVANHIDPAIPLLHVCLLTEDESWSLFLKMVRRDPRSSVFSDQGQIREKILQKCGGLPIAICFLAGFLSSIKFSIDAWLGVIEDSEQKENEEEREVSDDSRGIKKIAGGISGE
ncbi:probable disease resistance protein At1g59620 [Pistacia vera]|uniref:probable disease resistance protein At1g59620 n=1 Tax=Pistacia vera TaxID=55513 RepID=UPI001263D6B5|nr:probable disease resistance protein At1g59620 [Pistacia vera]